MSRPDDLTWQITIATIPHRFSKLLALLDVLEPQIEGNFGVRVLAWQDNLEHTYAQKLQGLYDAATAEYVSNLSDDDSVAPDFIPRCLAAMAAGPDQIGFKVRYTEYGIRQMPVWHSLHHAKGWYPAPGGLYRDHMYYNPVRRELADRVRFRGEFCDEEWAADLRELDHEWTEEFIDAEMLYYQHDRSDDFHTPKAPMDAADIMPRPQRPWLDWYDPDEIPGDRQAAA